MLRSGVSSSYDRLDDGALVVGEHLPRLEDPRDHAWVQDLLELFEPARIAKHDVSKLSAIDLLVLAEHPVPNCCTMALYPVVPRLCLVPGDAVGVQDARPRLGSIDATVLFPAPIGTREPDDERAHPSVSLDPAFARPLLVERAERRLELRVLRTDPDASP